MKKSWNIQGIIIPSLLIFALLFSSIFSYAQINELQGNARVINYSGIVRGATQRLIKLEINEKPNDALITRLDNIVNELQSGNGKDDLIRLDDAKFQKTLADMQVQWNNIKEEIYLLRRGKDDHQLFDLSEQYFQLCDNAVARAESYTRKQVHYAEISIILLTIAFILLTGILGWYVQTQRRLKRALDAAEQENRDRNDHVLQMYNEFRTPMDEMSELAYISDISSYELLFINETGKKTFHVEEELKGQKCYEILQNRTSPCPFCNSSTLKPNENCTWEFTNLVSKRHYLLKDRLIEWNGHAARLEIAFDITDTEKEKIELKNLLDAEKMLMECVRVLYEEEDLGIALKDILLQLGSYLHVERAYLFSVEDNIFHNTYEWCEDTPSPRIDYLQDLPKELLDHWIEIFNRGECICITDIESIRESNAIEYERLSVNGITSLVVIPLEHNGKLSGFLGVDNPAIDKMKNIVSYLQTLRYFIMIAYRKNESEQQLSNLSYHDTLTTFYNRNRYIEDLEHFSSYHESLGVVFLDVNGLKDINDYYGHMYGDKVLIECAQSIRSVFKIYDFYRIGGDEFVIICKNISEQSFFEMIRELKYTLCHKANCQAAIGSCWVDETTDIQSVIATADAHMYDDKKAYYQENVIATNRYRHHSDEILLLTNPDILKSKINLNQFVVYLQPKISSDTYAIVGAEALIRYAPKKDCIIMPSSFLSLLEEMQVINHLDFFVFEYVCTKIKEWEKAGKAIIPISVNFSRCTLSEPIFLKRLISLCDKYQINKEYLELEITENNHGVVSIDMHELITRIREAGFSISIDDFGAQYSNISLLTSIDFDVLKLDKSLIDTIEDNTKSRAIIKIVADYCTNLNIILVAEGVENEEQLKICKECGIKIIQGYLFSKPITIAEFESAYVQ